VLRSTRASAGVGVSTSALGPVRLELTYAVPLRYGPRDVRRAFQFGMGLNV
jgi:outer membrane protein assembly factor BamA